MYVTYRLYANVRTDRPGTRSAARPSTRKKAADTVELSAGPLQVRDSGGTGEPVLLVHGLLVDGRLWDAVAALLEAEGLRVVVPDLPLGAHKTPMRPDAPLAPPDIARLLGELAESSG